MSYLLARELANVLALVAAWSTNDKEAIARHAQAVIVAKWMHEQKVFVDK